MTENLVNWKHFNEFQHIFGREKMAYLWQEYLTQSRGSWQKIPPEVCEELRLTFHSWKSSSQIFGLDEFSKRCARIEDHILNRRHLDLLPEMIHDCKNCFEASTAEIIPYFEKWKPEHA